MPLISQTLKDLLVCPLDKSELLEIEDSMELECVKCGRRYKVKGAIPVMLPDDEDAKEGHGDD